MASGNHQNETSRTGKALTPLQYDALLTRIDQAETAKTWRNRRTSQRLPYRALSMLLTVRHGDGERGEFHAAARDLGSSGMSFLHSGFLHSGTNCVIELPRLDGRLVSMGGQVTWCRHIMGPHHIVGMRFDRRIKPREFIKSEAETAGVDPAALSGSLLLIDEQELDRALVVNCLRDTRLVIEEVADCRQALAKLAKQKFDLVLCELGATPDQDPPAALRKVGYAGPIIVATAEPDPARLTAARQAGANSILAKPYAPGELIDEISTAIGCGGARSEDPIVSQAQNRPGMAPLIKKYLKAASENAKHINEARQAKNFQAVRGCCKVLKGSSGGMGFPQVSRAARDVMDAMDAANSLEACTKQIDELLALCRRLAA
jgi:CheY-like chemotaxis protein